MFWHSHRGLYVVVPLTAIVTYTVLDRLVGEPRAAVLEDLATTAGSGTDDGRSLEVRAMARSFGQAARGPRIVRSPLPWRLQGELRDREGRALGAADVLVELDRNGFRRSIGRTASDEGGRFALDLEAVKRCSAAFRDGARLELRIEARGHVPLVRRLELPRLDTRQWTPKLVLLVDPGAMVRGRVFDESRQPVAGAALYLSGPETRRRFFDRQPVAWTDAFGRYEIGVDELGDYVLEAHAPGLGASDRVPLSLRGLGVAQGPDLTLGSGAVAQGTLVYPDGSPIARARLLGVVVPRPEGRTPRMVSDRAEAFVLETGDDGAFRVGGLVRGRFRIGDPEGALPGLAGELRSGDRAARLVVDHQRLRLSLVDGQDLPLPGTELQYGLFRGGPATEARRLLEAGGALEEVLALAFAKGSVRTAERTGRSDLYVPRGAFCWLRTWLPGCEPLERGFTLGEHDNELRVELRVLER